MTSLLMSSPPISISHRLFRCRYSNSRDVVASSPSFSRPAARVPRRACSQAIFFPNPASLTEPKFGESRYPSSSQITYPDNVFRITHCILVKSQIPGIPFQTLIKRGWEKEAVHGKVKKLPISKSFGLDFCHPIGSGFERGFIFRTAANNWAQSSFEK